MARKTSAKSNARVRLSKELVVNTAIQLADEEGVASLTMRKLAERLGVEAMSLYYHVANKDAILDAMVDAVFAEISLPRPEDGWKTAMSKRAHSLREALLRHPWSVGVLESRPNPGMATLEHHEAVISCLRQAGFTIEMAAHAFSALDSYIYGFVMQENTLPFETPEELEVIAAAILQQMPVEEFPYFTEMIREYNLKPDYSYANEFEIGLDLLLDGLERMANVPG